MTIAGPTGGIRRRVIDDDEYYPTGDGKPMAESDKHRKLMTYCIELLEERFADGSDVQVSGNNFLYWQQGNRKAVVSPDVYVVFGVEKKLRDSYMLWRENGVLPTFVLEITSKSTKREAVKTKRPLYEQTLGISEYFLFDPTGDYLKPRLQGYRLVEGRYVQITPEGDPLGGTLSDAMATVNDETPIFSLHSEQLGLDVAFVGERLNFYDSLTGVRLLGAIERAEVEAAARLFAERRAMMEGQRAEAERQRAEAEAQRAEQLEAELIRLRAELEAERRARE